MRRISLPLLNLVIIAGLMFGGLRGDLAPAATDKVGLGTGTVPAAAAKSHANNGGQKKHNQKKKRSDRHRDRKQKDRKQDRQRQRHKNRQAEAGQPVELPTGILPGADTADPDVDSGKISAQDHYIVLLKSDTVSAQGVANDIASGTAGVTPTFVYHNVFNGFAAVIPPDKLDAVRNDPNVEAVVPDAIVTAFDQTIPTGIRRIGANQNTTADIDGIDERVDVDVAVLDTAGKGLPSDLNQHAWANCTPSHVNSDDNGHGTHVSGTIGAIDDTNGVVGVAPGARIWNIRVLVNGSGLSSWIICGLDIVKEYANGQPDPGDGLGTIEVANLSLGGTGSDSDCATNAADLYHQAFCRVVDAGVTVVVAAGNSHIDASGTVPATYQEVITVAALADSNGVATPIGPPTSRGNDETLATFSNFGADVDIAAPGVDILSTVPTGSCDICDPTGFETISGTSMASPHVAGAAALYLATHPGKTPLQVKQALQATGESATLSNSSGSFSGKIVKVADPGFSTASAAAGNEKASAAGAQQTKHRHDRQKHQRQQKGKSKR